MTDYREIIRLHSLKFSNVAIANSLCCSRNTVSEVLKLAETHSLEWPIPETLTNRDIGHLFYPGRGNNEGRRLPDYEYVYNELAKPGVTLSLLWAEYCAKCEAEHTIPYQHSQFNDKLQFTMPSGLHSVLERPFSEANGRPFLVKRFKI